MFRSMDKLCYKTTNWKQYNQALINRGSLTFWIEEEIIQLLNQAQQDHDG
ncbi:Mobile element protein [Candidatus Enterovibrio altilux]|uniref:Mobile element protein n=1 Tax=Candidatus Enterovibrio altilux TaxID=1927128 RepID=A0A291BBQ0_9GAMM|nr:Mobile element protein [Candidatus Enterovibrio luxaltus]